MEEGRGAGGERSGEGQVRNRRIPFRNKGRGKGFRAHCRPVPRLEGLPPRVAKLVHDLEEDNKFLTRQIVHLQHKVIALQQGAPSAAATSTGRSRRCQGQQTDPGTPEGLGEPQQPSQPSPPASALSLGTEIALLQEVLSEAPEMEADSVSLPPVSASSPRQ